MSKIKKNERQFEPNDFEPNKIKIKLSCSAFLGYFILLFIGVYIENNHKELSLYFIVGALALANYAISNYPTPSKKIIIIGAFFQFIAVLTPILYIFATT
ncbi:hypothetical protein [Proteus penneri]|uniref:hypothetical protein n=1 Tax=Proteus penneri TaxID=102862 RepID=UPI00288C4E11|nr:hypothetical protein [Proteus penneri]